MYRFFLPKNTRFFCVFIPHFFDNFSEFPSYLTKKFFLCKMKIKERKGTKITMYHVLLADDEARIRQGLRNIVNWEELGFTIVGETADGEETAAFLCREKPDVVLLDITMPKLSGLEVLQKAKEGGFTGKAIIVSGYSDFKFAQEAIRLGVENYLTKPIDETELEQILRKLQKDLTEETRKKATEVHYFARARKTILRDLFLSPNSIALLELIDVNTSPVPYQVVLYEKYAPQQGAALLSFEKLLHLPNRDLHAFDTLTIENTEAVLLKGEKALLAFRHFVEACQKQRHFSIPTPLDAVFLTYGRPVSSLTDVHMSYQQARALLQRKFFIPQGVHLLGYDMGPSITTHAPLEPGFLNACSETFLSCLQSFNRNRLAAELQSLEQDLRGRSSSVSEILYFLTDLYLHIKEQILRLYGDNTFSFPTNSWAMEFIQSRTYLYEIMRFFFEQFELIMRSIGTYSKESVIDDIVHYIDHNYMKNLKLENLAPLFGYNCSYLGKLLKQKTGRSFNTYLDEVRIRVSRDLLQDSDMKVYEIAEAVGYSNVDYFSLKFKKSLQCSPLEYRRQYRDKGDLPL